MEQEAEEAIAGYVGRFRAQFRDPPLLNRDEHGVILCAYGRIISEIFVTLMLLAYSKGRSPQAKDLLWGNIEVEVNQNHIEMLRRFAACAADYEEDARVQQIAAANQSTIVDLFRACLHGPVAAGFALMALWEAMSQVFMPEIRYAGEVFGQTDFTYPDCHGVFDVGHARDCIRALALECQERGAPLPTQVLDLGYVVMCNIFRPDLIEAAA